MTTDLPYDPKSKSSILSYAQNLIGGTLRKKCSGDIPALNDKRKGYFGTVLEEFYFKYPANSDSRPDFEEVGVELKSSPIKKLKRGEKFSAKERMVMNVIDYEAIHKETFEESSFWTKNQFLLLVLYVYEKEQEILDYLIKYADYWDFPKTDLKIIKDDWNKIKQKVLEGKAHEISEGDTVYLGACTKGANKGSVRSQPFNDEYAKQRAFSLKQSYVTNSILRSFEKKDAEKKVGNNIIEDEAAFLKSEKTFEEFVIAKFEPYYGKTIEDLHKELGLKTNKQAKQYFAMVSNELVRKVLGITGRKIEEFEKGNIKLKTIRLLSNDKPAEHIPFKAFKYKEIVNEEWKYSEFLEQLLQRFFLVFFQYETDGTLRLKRAFFWSMPFKDIEQAEGVWRETVKRVNKGETENYPKISENPICHVRPHATKTETYEMPQGFPLRKRSFWLNAKYIQEVYRQHALPANAIQIPPVYKADVKHPMAAEPTSEETKGPDLYR